jgi:DnaJ-class molecular chaperone
LAGGVGREAGGECLERVMEQRDYYDILGVDGNASQPQIKEAYRRLALQYHPDRNKEDPAAAERMKEINEAYAVISDPSKRRQYDSLRQTYGSSAYGHFRQSYSEEDIFRGSDVRQVFEKISKAFGFRGFDDIFREFYGPGYRSFEFRGKGSLGQGFSLCGNLGRVVKYLLKKSWGVELPERGKDRDDRVTISPELAGTGGKMRYTYRVKSKELLVNIPPGIREGQRIRLRGMGDSGKGGAEAGDLYVEVRIRSPFSQRIREMMKGVWFRVFKGRS